MTITRWDPFNDLLRIQKRMNRLFEDSLEQSREVDDKSLVSGNWSPQVDIYETGEKVVLVADLPGVREEDLDIQVENNTLTLKGERRMQKDVNQENYHRIERGYGTFQRSFTLPTSIDQDRIRAEHRHGILEISLPKAEGTRPKKIPVQVSRS